MQSRDRKHFQLYFRFALLGSFVLAATPKMALEVPKNCIELATKIRSNVITKDANGLEKLDASDLVNFAYCIRDIYKLYKEFDIASLKTADVLLPEEIHSLIKAVLSKKKGALSKWGLEFVPTSLFYKTVELYNQARSLEVDQKNYRRQFEAILRSKVEPLLDVIDRELACELFPGLAKTLGIRNIITETVMAKLDRVNDELGDLLKKIYDARTAATKGKLSSALTGSGSFFVSALAFSLGFAPPAFLGAAACSMFGSVFNFLSFTVTARELQTLINEVETVRNEIKEYRSLYEYSSVVHHNLRIAAIILLFLFPLLMLRRIIHVPHQRPVENDLFG